MELIAAIIGSGLITTLITLFVTRGNRDSERRKIEADAEHTIGDAWSKLLEPMEKRIETLEAVIAELETAGKKKECMIMDLQKRVKELEEAALEKDQTIQAQAARINELETEVDILKKQLEALGHKPKVKRA